MESKKEITKNLLANSFKKLILDIPFKNITIKMITDKSKVIRPTFYHHFKDKYEVLEYIVDEDIMKNIYEMVDSDMEYESLKIIFIRIIDKHELNELYYSNVLTKENMARYYTNGLISFIELWVDKGCEYSGIDMFEAYTYMVSHSIMDIIKK